MTGPPGLAPLGAKLLEFAPIEARPAAATPPHHPAYAARACVTRDGSWVRQRRKSGAPSVIGSEFPHVTGVGLSNILKRRNGKAKERRGRLITRDGSP